MKKFLSNIYFLVTAPVAIVLLEVLPISAGMYIPDKQKGLDMKWLIAAYIVQGILLAAFMAGMAMRAGWKTVLVNVVLIALIVSAFEYVLYKKDPFLKLPMDSFYYAQHYYKYKNILPEQPHQLKLTWGHTVRKNKYGFRDKDFVVPKPADVFRIMAIGDSFTFGAGLAEDERYTNVLEKMLKNRHPNAAKRVEVINLGIPGMPSLRETQLMEKFMDLVTPDLVIVGFCYNDLRLHKEEKGPEGRNYRRYFKKYNQLLQQRMNLLHLNYTGELLVKLAEKAGKWYFDVPKGLDVYKHSYEKTSDEWRFFLQSLAKMKQLTDSRGIHPPLLAILDHFPAIKRPEDVDNPSPELKMLLEYLEQVRVAAVEAGLETVSFEETVFGLLKRGELKPEQLPLNVLDAHPSRNLNEIYATGIYHALIAHVDAALTSAASRPGAGPGLSR